MSKDTQEITTDDVAGLGTAMDEFYAAVEALPLDDPELVQERILRSIMTATTADDIVNAGTATPAEELSGVPVIVRAIHRGDSSFVDQGSKYYLHIDCTIVANGDNITVATGAQDVIVKLVRLHQLGLLPMTVTMQKATTATAKGYYPLFLRAAPAPF